MKLNIFKSLKVKLFLWYVGSLLVLILYFLLFVHFFTIPYGLHFLILLFFILALIGFLIIYQITRSLTYLSSRMKQISSKNLEERITDIKGEDEIGKLAFAFNSLLNRLDEAFKRERQFIADVAHEMKTPLSTLKSSFEVALQRERSNEEYQQIIKEAIVESNDLSDTLRNVLDLAWSETPYAEKKGQKFNLSDVMEDLFDIGQKLAIRKKIRVQAQIAQNIHVSGFKDKLARAILNIIDNAIKYTPAKGFVTLTLEAADKRVFIIIKDTGQGIASSEIPHIFDRFYRGKATDKIFGAGLGLAISKSIIAIHQGEIKVESRSGQGSRFIISLPSISSS